MKRQYIGCEHTSPTYLQVEKEMREKQQIQVNKEWRVKRGKNKH
jgi:hypothetical protein